MRPHLPLDRLRALRDRLRATARAHQRLDGPVAIAALAVLFLLLGTGVWLFRAIFSDLPNGETVRGIGNMAQATRLYDLHDHPAFTIYQERRVDVPLSSISPHLVRAVIATEDQRFYDHGGVDVVRVAGAAINNVRQRRRAQGASTITQQLARQAFLSPDKTLRRKVKEAIVALRIEHEFTKDQILELYLNKVYFGDGLYGVETASLGFFGKHASELDLPESAMLAGLVKSPSTNAPTVSLDRAIARRNVVLQAMEEAGSIDEATRQAAARAPVHLVDRLRREEIYGQYFREEVRKELVDRFGWDRVYQGGLRVYTTLDLDMQKAAESEVQRALTEIERRQARTRAPVQRPDDRLQAALVVMDPSTGEVRAMVGGRDFQQSRFNRATQARRQAGSSFKPFIYAAALERGYTPATLITDLDNPIQTFEGAWVPDDEHLASSAMTIRAALRTSSNRAAVQMLQEVGIPETVQYVERMGVGSVPSVPSLALGSGEVTLLAMTAAYSAFANQGMLYTPTLLRRVEDADGTILYQSVSHGQRVVSEATAFMMTSMLADVINAGTAWPARREGFTLPAGGKTGTTNDYRDVWFIGFTPKLAAGVWMGYDQPRTIIGRGYAADLAVPLWARFMKQATRGDEPVWFRPPPNVVGVNICRVSGKLPLDGCRDAIVVDRDGELTRRSMVYTEYFVRGTEPQDVCPVHVNVPGDDVVGTTGRLQVPDQVKPVTESSVIANTTILPPLPHAPIVMTAPPPPPPQKKPGLWGRMFGLGGK